MSIYNVYINTLRAYCNGEEVNPLIEWLETTDVKAAPASTKFYNACEEGWLNHQINVLNRLIKEVKNEYGDNFEEKYSKATIAKVALLHDLYKLNYYEQYNRNVKNEETGKWETVKEYRVKEDAFVYGTPGDNSVRIVERFFKLTDDEAIAIKYAYGIDDETNRAMLHKINKRCPLALLLQTAVQKTIDIDEQK